MPPRVRSSSVSLIGISCIAAAVLISGYICMLSLSRGASIDSSGLAPDTARNRILSRLNARRHLHIDDGVTQHTHDSPDSDKRRTGVECPACPACPVQQPAQQVLTTAHYLHNPRRYHIITTTAGFSNHWQVRIHYYWYKRQKEACEQQAVCDMGGFTRLLHTGHGDDLMDEVPTVVVDPLPKSAFGGMDDSYIVLNRPYAFVEWLSKASVPEKYILMCESDHLIMRPIPNMMNGEAMGAALFSYMDATKYPEVIRSLVGNVSDAEIATIPRIGNSPTFISVKDMRVQAPMWYNTTMDIWKDDKAHKAWNWVLEMYGFAVGSYRAGLHKDLYHSLSLLAHPPFDSEEIASNGEPFYLLHLTYPMKFNTTGHFVDDEKDATYILDKRKFSEMPPPRNLPTPPPYVKNDLVRLAVSMINEATNNIPCWDVYHATKVVTDTCAPGSSAVTGSKDTANQA